MTNVPIQHDGGELFVLDLIASFVKVFEKYAEPRFVVLNIDRKIEFQPFIELIFLSVTRVQLLEHIRTFLKHVIQISLSHIDAFFAIFELCVN